MNRPVDSPPAPVRVSLVIPVRDEAATIHELFESIAAQTRRPDEVVLVDGGSRDNTVALLREAASRDASFRVVEAGEATPGRGRNVGIAAARHDWIALTDAGNRLEPRWLERLLEAARRDPSAALVYGNYEPVGDSFFERCVALAFIQPKEERPGGVMRDRFIASSLVRREAWAAVGGFPDLRAAEDLMFMEAVERRFRVGYAPGATVWWRLQPTFARTFRRFVLYSRHNVWAGRQRFWHYGIARLYLAALVPVGLALAHSAWWLLLIVAGMAARVGKGIWRRREGRGLLWALNPVQFLCVTGIALALDLATFVGWAQALWRRPPAKTDAPPQATTGEAGRATTGETDS